MMTEEEVKEAAERMAKTYRENYGRGKDILMPSVWRALARVALEFCEERLKEYDEAAKAFYDKKR